MANKTINTFGGVNTDTSINKYPNNKYYAAKNLRPITNDSLSTGALTNVPAPLELINESLTSGTILGSTLVRDTLVIFYVTASGNSIILKSEYGSSSYTEVYNDLSSTTKLSFNSNYPIKAVGRYESIDSQKVYWCDGLNTNSFINIADNNSGKEASNFRLTPDAELNSPIPTEVTSGGNLEAGTVYYTYQLYRKYGNQTTMSPSSFGIPLSSRNGNNIKGFRGDEVGVNTEQAVTLNINNIDQNFDKIKIYSIHFADLNADPSINLILDSSISSTTTTIIDTGSISLATLSVEEFLIQGGRIFSSQTLETKYNYLFAGNIKESFIDIDFDARTYRFNNSNVGYPVEIGGSTSPVSSGNWDNVNDDGNAINPFNDFDNDLEYKNANNSSPSTAVSSQNYKYVNGGGGVLQGGSGPYIGYTFVTQGIESNTTDSFKSGKLLRNINNVSNSFLNPILAGKYKGYKRNEVYRLGIEFYFKNGQKSFVKWIGDIRFPAVWEYVLSSTASNVISNQQLGLRMTIDLRDLSSDEYNSLSGIKIVRAKRTNIDKNILGQGLFGAYQTAEYDNDGNTAKCSYGRIPGIYDISQGNISVARTELIGGTGGVNDMPLSQTLYEFNSPDFIFGATPSYSGNDYINLIGSNEVDHDNNSAGDAGGTPRGFFKEKNYVPDATTTNLRGFNYKRILDGSTNPSIKTQGNSTASLFSFASKTCANRVIIENNDNDYNGIRSKHSLLDMDSSVPSDTVAAAALDLSPADDYSGVFVAEYIRNKFGSQYNGNTYDARTVTDYIPALCRLGNNINDDVVEFVPISEFNDATVSKVLQLDVFGGDTYVSNFDYLRSQFDQNISSDVSMQEYITFPVESSINLDYRRDEILKYYTGGSDHTANNDIYKVQERKTFGVSLFPNTYPDQLTDLYLYNDAYSRNNDIVKNTQKPENFQESVELDTMVIASNKKFNGELIDSWTQFNFNTFLELDSEYGPLNVLKRHNNRLYFFQNNGFGVLAVEDREQLSTSSGIPLSLGTGAVLERYDYASTHFGALRDEAVISTPNNLYFIDEYDKSIRILSDTDLNGNLSKIKGVSNKIHTLLPSTYLALGYDPRNKEVLFSFDNTTFVYSELLQEFIGEYDILADKTYSNSSGVINPYKADVYQSIRDELIFIGKDNYTGRIINNKLNDGAGSLGDYSEITLIIHPQSNDVFTFDNLDIRTNVFDNRTKALPLNVDELDDTIHEIDYKNSYLPLTTVTTNPGLTNALIHRLARIWRTRVPQTSNNNRFVDTYLMVTLRYNNSGTNKLLLHDITTYVRPAKIRK